MFNSKYNTLLTVLLVVAIVAIVGIIMYLGYSLYNKYYINASAKNVVETFQEAVSNNTTTTTTENETETDGDVTIGDVEGSSIYNESSGSSTTTTYYGYNVIGTISIPKIDIEYPILEKSTPQSLKVAVAYLTGAGINKVGNTVLQGHNYKNGLFFSSIGKLSNGDTIYITDTSGTKVEYAVYSNFTADSTDTSFYNRDTDGKREITLSTCTDDDSNLRTIILAREV